MKKLIILLLVTATLLGGCLEQKAVERGNVISVDYTESLQNGTVLSTTIESIAKEHNIYSPKFNYTPFQFTVGKGTVISGLSSGVIGMKIGQTKTFTVPPENGYGRIRPDLIKVYPIIESIPTRIPRVIEVPNRQFEAGFGRNHTVGDIVTLQSGINMTIKEISSNVSLSYNFKVGDRVPAPGMPWNITVVKLDERNITVKYSVKKNDTIQFPNIPWNTTVTNVTEDNITLRSNAIPDTEIEDAFGRTRVKFNETSIIMDQNHELAGKNLTFNVTLISIDKEYEEGH